MAKPLGPGSIERMGHGEDACQLHFAWVCFGITKDRLYEYCEHVLPPARITAFLLESTHRSSMSLTTPSILRMHGECFRMNAKTVDEIWM
jgi:hypothetical protein